MVRRATLAHHWEGASSFDAFHLLRTTLSKVEGSNHPGRPCTVWYMGVEGLPLKGAQNITDFNPWEFSFLPEMSLFLSNPLTNNSVNDKLKPSVLLLTSKMRAATQH